MCGEIIQIKNGTYDARNYKQILKLYKKTVEQYKNESCKIRFNGVTLKGEVGVLFVKENIIKTKEMLEAEYLNKVGVDDILASIQKSYNYLLKKEKALMEKQSLCDKQISVILHNLEADFYKTKDEKLEAFHSMVKFRKQKRIAKNEYTYIVTLQRKGYFDMVDTNKVNSSIEMIDNNKSKEKTIQEKIKRNGYPNSVKIFAYKNDKERISLMKQLQAKYDKVIRDESKMTYSCYNNSYNSFGIRKKA